MKYYYKHNRPSLLNAEFIRVERQKLNPLFPGSFASIAYWKLSTGEIIGIVF